MLGIQYLLVNLDKYWGCLSGFTNKKSWGGLQGYWFSSFMGTFHREEVNFHHTHLDLPKNKWELCSQEMCVCLVCLPRKLEMDST